MGIQDLQIYIQNHAAGGTGVVDLLRIARNRKPQQPGRKLRLVLDAECCLDRLYGGYFSDWASGGQWNRMVQFLAILCQQMALNGIELVVFFNGSLEQARIEQWAANQQNTRRNVSAVLRHLSGKGTPPPKVWWVPPVCLRTCLRMALRHLNINVVCSMDDHRQEVIAYCRENNFQGLLVEDPEYAAFDPPRYFSSEHLKLTYKGALETKEYLLARVAETLKLGSGQLAILAALLGTHLLGEDELSDFHRKVCPEHPTGKIPAEDLVKGVAGFISNLGAVANNTNQLISQVFDGPVTGNKEAGRAARLRAAIQYYLNGTKDGFLKYKPQQKGGRNNHRFSRTKYVKTEPSKQQTPTTETLKFASETAESERDSLAAYKEATANSTQLAPEIVVEPVDPSAPQADQHDKVTNGVVNGISGLQLSNSSSSSNSNVASPSHSPASQSNTVMPSGESNTWTPPTAQAKTDETESRMLGLVSPEVMRTACERHQKGLMSPNIYQVLTQGEIKLNAVLEDEHHKEFPSTHHFYRPVRQMVYGVLFNLHHLNYIQIHKDDPATTNQQQLQQPSPDPESIVVKEWVWSKSNQYAKPELVKPEKLGWGVPTIQRLWFGSTIDDKRRRLRAFLSCMHSDTPLMLSPAHVPQPMLVFACVIRYMMSFPERRILRKNELDALIVQAHSPELMNATYLQDLQLPRLSSRGVQLATLVMAGIENALFANDACGAPIPWLMCCPWLFFDGKLFQHKILKAETSKNLVELCDHRIDEVVKVERMRQAILEGINPQFARLPLIPSQGPVHPMRGGVPAVTMLPAGATPLMGHQQMRGVRNQQSRPQRTVLARGGQLEIAGVVVGQWGPNYGSNLSRGTNAHQSHHNYQANKSYHNYGGPPAGLPQSLMNSSSYGGGRCRGGVNKSGRFNSRGRGTTPNRRSRGVSNHSSGTKRSTDKETKTRGLAVNMSNGTSTLASKFLNGGEKTDPMLEIGQFEDGSTNQQQTSSSSSLTPAQ